MSTGKNKMNSEVKQGGFVMLPNDFHLRSRNHLSMNEMVVFLEIVQHSEKWNDSISSLSKRLKIDKRNMSRYIKKLESVNLIKYTSGKDAYGSNKHRRSRIEIVNPKYWFMVEGQGISVVPFSYYLSKMPEELKCHIQNWLNAEKQKRKDVASAIKKYSKEPKQYNLTEDGVSAILKMAEIVENNGEIDVEWSFLEEA